MVVRAPPNSGRVHTQALISKALEGLSGNVLSAHSVYAKLAHETRPFDQAEQIARRLLSRS